MDGYYDQQQYEQAQPSPNQSFFSTDSVDDDLITKWQLDTARQLLKLEQYLSGKVYDKDKRKYVNIQGVPPIMNSAGIRYTMFKLRGVLDKNTGLSHITPEDCNRITRMHTLAYLHNLFRNLKTYELQKDNLAAVVRIFMTNTFLLLRRAVNGGERELMKTIRKEVFAVRQDNIEPQRPKGMLSGLPQNWGGNR